MASVQAVQHKDRMAKAYAALEMLGAQRKTITPFLNNILKLYNNEWDFIEAENYSTLADNYFEYMDAKTSSRDDGPVTRAKLANSGSDPGYNSDDSASPVCPSPPPETPPSSARAGAIRHGGGNARSNALVSVKREHSSPRGGRAVNRLPVNVARGVEYHSGASVRTRSSQAATPRALGGSPGTRGRVIDHSPSATAMGGSPGTGRGVLHHNLGFAVPGGKPGTRGRVVEYNCGGGAAASLEKEKGKSPLMSESRPSPSQCRGGYGNPNLVKAKPEAGSLSVPEGFEKVAFERVDGLIIPTIRGPQNGEVTPVEEAHEPPPFTCRVKIELEGPDPQRDLRNNVYAPAPLLAKDPTTNTGIRVKTEPLEGDVTPYQCEDENLDQVVQRELSLEVNPQPSPGRLQIVPYANVLHQGFPTSEQLTTFNGGPFTDTCTFNLQDAQEAYLTVLPVADRMEDCHGNVLSLVDYGFEDDHSLEPPVLGTLGASCDVVLIPDEFSEEVGPCELNDEEEIRPNFTVNGTPKRDMADAEEVGIAKQQRCEGAILARIPLRTVEREKDVVKTASSAGTNRRRLILPESPGHEAVKGKNEGELLEGAVTVPSSPAGVKRKLIVSANSSHEGTGSALKGFGNWSGRNDNMLEVIYDRCEERFKKGACEGRGQVMNSALKRVKLDPGIADPKFIAPQLKHNPADISRGMERVPIPYVNEFTSETINYNFNYIPSNVVYQQAYINISLARIGDEDFCLDCVGNCLNAPHSCPCTRETGGEFAYTENGCLKPEYIQYELDMNQDPELKLKNMVFCATAWDCPIERARNDLNPEKCKGHVARKFVKECWHKCGCSMSCGNRVVQGGINRQLQVFFTKDGKGWGIRTAEDLPAGTFVCEYVGEIMTNMELDQRNQETKKIDTSGKSGNHKDTYPVLLDGDWCSERGLKDEEALCLDATRYGNVARFINHRCFDANLIDIPVSIEGLDRHYYHVAFFTSRDVRAWEELTWDYKIDFDDHEHPIEAFQCLCKSELCRGGLACGSKKHKK